VPPQQNYLGLSNGDAESYSNAFLTVVALSGIVGAAYSDVFAGPFKVQWQASIVWMLGASGLFFLTSFSPSQETKLTVAAVAWALLAFGLGSMMPSQAAFVGQQLVDPDPIK
jgi:dipeptide/tripeptide permease